MISPTATRTAGRLRSSEADQAILQTTLRLLVEQGYDAMSMEGVASAAGVGKTTIYRRYPGKRELVVAAVSSLAASVEPPPDSGNTYNDLLDFTRQMFDVMRNGPGFSMVGTLLVKEREDPTLLDLFRRRVMRPRMELVTDILRRGIERGEVRAGIPIETTVLMLAGSLFSRHISGQPEDDAWLQSMVDTLWQGLAVR